MKTAVAAPAPGPSPDELLEIIAHLSLKDFVEFKQRFIHLINETRDPFTCLECGIPWPEQHLAGCSEPGG